LSSSSSFPSRSWGKSHWYHPSCKLSS
jgi:hypothetical protein